MRITDKQLNDAPTATISIDTEPKWVAVLRGVEAGYFQASELRKACEIADIVRQAQKQGAKKLTFVFSADGTITPEVTL